MLINSINIFILFFKLKNLDLFTEVILIFKVNIIYIDVFCDKVDRIDFFVVEVIVI